MKSDVITRRRPSERGDSNIKFILYLGVIALVGYLLIKNVPMYFEMQNFKQEIADTTRGMGAQGMPLEKVKLQIEKIGANYGIEPQQLAVSKQGDTIVVRVNVTRKVNLLVTDYDWVINEEYKQVKF